MLRGLCGRAYVSLVMGPGSSGSGAWSMTTMVVYLPSVGLSSTRRGIGFLHDN